MKIQLDTIAKIIRIEEAVNLGELSDILEKLLPNGEWKTYKLEVSVIHNWSSPNPWVEIPHYPYPLYPWVTNPCTVLLSTGTAGILNADTDNKNGVFNLELSSN